MAYTFGRAHRTAGCLEAGNASTLFCLGGLLLAFVAPTPGIAAEVSSSEPSVLRVVILPFENTTDDSTLDALELGLPDLLRVRLSEAQALEVIVGGGFIPRHAIVGRVFIIF